MKMTVNGITHHTVEGATLDVLLAQLGLAARAGVAIAINQAVIPRGRWSQAGLNPDDDVLIIQPTQGG